MLILTPQETGLPSSDVCIITAAERAVNVDKMTVATRTTLLGQETMKKLAQRYPSPASRVPTVLLLRTESDRKVMDLVASIEAKNMSIDLAVLPRLHKPLLLTVLSIRMGILETRLAARMATHRSDGY
jgi:hypothetical protein